MKSFNNYVSVLKTCALLYASSFSVYAAAPLGMFFPYDINIKLKKPAAKNFEFIVLGEKSYNVHGYATNLREDATYLTNVLQIYEPAQNVVSMYQGFDTNCSCIQTKTTPFTDLLDSIAGGPGGGVSNLQNGIYIPTGNLSCGQVDFGLIYALGQGFYLSAFLPVCFAELSNVSWQYDGNNILFANAQIQTELINAFAQDCLTYFNLNIGDWKEQGLGDLAILAEWQRDFPQRKTVLKNVQANVRLGLTFPTGQEVNQNIIMPVPFGADGAFSVPMGGGLGLTMGNVFECGFSGQFWFYLSNQKNRRIQTFATQTSLLLPIVANTYKEFAVLQNFNLYAQLYTPYKRFSLKGLYQHWRKQEDKIFPLDNNINFDVVNASQLTNEVTRHQLALFAIYSPLKGDFKRIIPQCEIFWKGSFGGTRAAIASTFGAQFALIF